MPLHQRSGRRLASVGLKLGERALGKSLVVVVVVVDLFVAENW